MTAPDGSASPADQQRAIGEAMAHVAALSRAGHEVVLTHGNGPQVGNLLLKNELAAAVVPPVPLDWCGAQSQATLGMLLMYALDLRLRERAIGQRPAALVSRPLVDRHDAGVLDPANPIGRDLA